MDHNKEALMELKDIADRLIELASKLEAHLPYISIGIRKISENLTKLLAL